MRDQWTVSIETDAETGELVLPIPDDLLELMAWKPGDTLSWTERDGSWILTKKD